MSPKKGEIWKFRANWLNSVFKNVIYWWDTVSQLSLLLPVETTFLENLSLVNLFVVNNNKYSSFVIDNIMYIPIQHTLATDKQTNNNCDLLI